MSIHGLQSLGQRAVPAPGPLQRVVFPGSGMINGNRPVSLARACPRGRPCIGLKSCCHGKLVRSSLEQTLLRSANCPRQRARSEGYRFVRVRVASIVHCRRLPPPTPPPRTPAPPRLRAEGSARSTERRKLMHNDARKGSFVAHHAHPPSSLPLSILLIVILFLPLRSLPGVLQFTSP